MESTATMEFSPVVAMPTATRDFLVVSIHDVAPSNREVVAKIISDLGAIGVRVCSLLVVPDYHHQGLFTQDRQFVSWLRDLESQGHEIVIHGYFHQRPARTGETMAEKFVTQVYTQSEGEFYDLDYDEAFRRITKARDELRAAGFKPHGFVAPAWLLSADAERATRDADLEYTTRLATVSDLRSGKNFPARSLVYSVRNGWRRTTSLAWNGLLARLSDDWPLLRMSIHPPDRIHPRVWGQIIDCLRKMQSARTPITYQDWIAEQRSR